MAKYNLNQTLKTLDGKDLMIEQLVPPTTEGGEPTKSLVPLTAAEAILRALVHDHPANANESTDDKGAVYKLAERIKAAMPVAAVEGVDRADGIAEIPGVDVDFKAEEIVKIKQRIGQLWGVMTIGAILKVID